MESCNITSVLFVTSNERTFLPPGNLKSTRESMEDNSHSFSSKFPDSLLKDLCNELNINVNELLSGEKIKENDYMNKAEENFIMIKRKTGSFQIRSFYFRYRPVYPVFCCGNTAGYLLLPWQDSGSRKTVHTIFH